MGAREEMKTLGALALGAMSLRGPVLARAAGDYEKGAAEANDRRPAIDAIDADYGEEIAVSRPRFFAFLSGGIQQVELHNYTNGLMAPLGGGLGARLPENGYSLVLRATASYGSANVTNIADSPAPG